MTFPSTNMKYNILIFIVSFTNLYKVTFCILSKQINNNEFKYWKYIKPAPTAQKRRLKREKKI